MASLSTTAPLNAEELKETLTEIKFGKKTWKKESELILIKSMMKHIGSTDSELRDNLIYSVFCNLIMEKQLDHKLLIEILDVSLDDEMLFKGIGEAASDTVFTRSFTTLLIALILYSDNQDRFLTKPAVFLVKDKLINYINLETDLRGYVPNRGWAHSIAHVADAFDELVKSKSVQEDQYLEILNALWDKVFVSDSVYIHGEEERILTPIIEMLNKGLDYRIIGNLVERTPAEILDRKSRIEEENYWMLYANCKNFLKSFYLKSEASQHKSILQKSIGNSLKSM